MTHPATIEHYLRGPQWRMLRIDVWMHETAKKFGASTQRLSDIREEITAPRRMSRLQLPLYCDASGGAAACSTTVPPSGDNA